MEEWKKVLGFEEYYEVSSLGNIKSLPRIISNGRWSRESKEKLLRPGIDKDGYKVVVLYGKLSKHNKKVHRLVCEAFHKNPLKLEHVNHKDLDKLNNSKSNVEWTSVR